MRRHQVLEQVGREDCVEKAVEVREAILDVCQPGRIPQRSDELDLVLLDVQPDAARSEMHQVLPIAAAGVEHRQAVRTIVPTNEADGSTHREKLANESLGRLVRQRAARSNQGSYFSVGPRRANAGDWHASRLPPSSRSLSDENLRRC